MIIMGDALKVEHPDSEWGCHVSTQQVVVQSGQRVCSPAPLSNIAADDMNSALSPSITICKLNGMISFLS